MTRICFGFAAAIAFTVAPTGVLAIPNAWVSKQTGVDDALCGAVATPCKTFQFAHNKVDAGGSILVRDPGGYGQLVITKAISVINDSGGAASIFVTNNTDGIAVSAPDGAVVLKGLTIDGLGQGNQGITLQSAANVTITNCTIQGFKAGGVFVAPVSGAINFTLVDSLVTHNKVNVWVSPNQGGAGGASVRGFLMNDIISNGEDGVLADGTWSTAPIAADVRIEQSRIVNNTRGVYALGLRSNIVSEKINVNFNGDGVSVAKSGNATLSRSNVSGNVTHDVFILAGIVQSGLDNIIGTITGATTPLSYK